MTEAATSQTRIPIEVARQYPATSSPTDDGPAGWQSTLAVTMLLVEYNCRTVGLVTLAAMTDDPEMNILGVEFDLRPEAARELSARLLAAADDAEDDHAPDAATGAAS